MTLLVLADAVSAVTFLGALGLVAGVPARVLPRECKVLLGVCLGIYGLVGVSNTCESAGLTGGLDRYEDFAELLFIPFFAYFVYSYRTAQETAKREATQAALREAEHRLRQIVDAAFEGIAVSAAGRFVEVNEGFASTFGFTPEELIGTEVLDRVAPDQRADAAEKLRTGYDRPYESVCLRRDGSRFPVEVCGKSVTHRGLPARVTALRDLTERKRAEEARRRLDAQILQAQKLESLGAMAGGIAHDFNNLLMGILGNADLALMRLPAQAPARTQVERMVAAAEKAAGLTRRMLEYAGQGGLLLRPVALPPLLNGISHLLAAEVPGTAKLHLRVPAELPAVLADEVQIQRVVIHLVTNAAEALGARPGSVTVSAGAMDADAAYLAGAHLNRALAPGPCAYVEVADTGCGMDAETLSRVFDPFFSTKFIGRGLGLPAVFGIVRAHRGAIRVRSEPGGGTEVRVLLPLAGAAADPRPAPETGGRHTVLVIDDEPLVLDVARSVLEEAGYPVLAAASGEQGVRLFRERHGEIGAVILDAGMPDLGGAEVLSQLRRIRAATPVLLVSGHTEEEARGRLGAGGLAGFLPKPFRSEALLEKLGALLPPPAGTGPRR